MTGLPPQMNRPTTADLCLIAATLHQRHPEVFPDNEAAFKHVSEVVDFLAYGADGPFGVEAD